MYRMNPEEQKGPARNRQRIVDPFDGRKPEPGRAPRHRSQFHRRAQPQRRCRPADRGPQHSAERQAFRYLMQQKRGSEDGLRPRGPRSNLYRYEAPPVHEGVDRRRNQQRRCEAVKLLIATFVVMVMRAGRANRKSHFIQSLQERISNNHDQQHSHPPHIHHQFRNQSEYCHADQQTATERDQDARMPRMTLHRNARTG